MAHKRAWRLTLPKRLRSYFRHDRCRRFAQPSWLAYRTLRDYLGAAQGEYAAAARCD